MLNSGPTYHPQTQYDLKKQLLFYFFLNLPASATLESNKLSQLPQKYTDKTFKVAKKSCITKGLC